MSTRTSWQTWLLRLWLIGLLAAYLLARLFTTHSFKTIITRGQQ